MREMSTNSCGIEFKSTLDVEVADAMRHATRRLTPHLTPPRSPTTGKTSRFRGVREFKSLSEQRLHGSRNPRVHLLRERETGSQHWRVEEPQVADSVHLRWPSPLDAYLLGIDHIAPRASHLPVEVPRIKLRAPYDFVDLAQFGDCEFACTESGG